MGLESIQISTDLKSALADFFSDKSYTAIAVLVDENTKEHCYPLVEKLIPDHFVIEIPSGEEAKNLKTCTFIWSALTTAQFDRNALLINLGGGVIGDMGGFAAATYKRGISFINLPTTLLSQVDASVGGKLGIDFNGFKNHIGMFQNPELVLINVDFLKTLPKRELRSGYAEVIKHSLIADSTYWPVLSGKAFEQQDWSKHVKHSVMVKKQVVTDDPQEKGLRKILNFGHTIGHAVETRYLEKGDKFLHGEAIAIGMVAEAYLSTKKTGLAKSDLEEIVSHIFTIFERTEIDTEEFDSIVKNAYQDKKNQGNTVKASLLSKIGDCEFNITLSENDVIEGLNYYNTMAQKELSA